MLQKLWPVSQMDAQWFRQKKSTGENCWAQKGKNIKVTKFQLAFANFTPQTNLIKTEWRFLALVRYPNSSPVHLF